MSGMEPEAQEFLKRISLTIATALAWLFINITIGIFGGWLFFYDRPTTGNIIFYIWFLISIVVMLKIYLRLWKKKDL